MMHLEEINHQMTEHITHLRLSDAEGLQGAVEALLGLGRHPERRVGVVQAIVDLLRQEDSRVREHAGIALGALSRHGLGLSRPVVVQAVLALLNDQDPQIRGQALIAVRDLVRQDELAHTVLMRSGGIDMLIALLRDQQAGVRGHAAIALGDLASHAPSHAAIVRSGGVDALVPLLRDGCVETRRAAVQASVRLMTGVAEKDWIDQLVLLVTDEDGEVRAHAVAAVDQLAWQQNEHKTAIVRSGGVSGLMALLKDTRAQVREHAAHALGALASKDEGSMAVVEAGGVEGLIALLTDEDAHVFEYAVDALKALSHHRRFRRSVIQAAVDVLANQKAKESGRAAIALRELACHHEANRTAMVEAGAMDPLMALWAHACLETRRHAAEALAALMSAVLAQSDLIDRLVSWLSEDDAPLRASGVSALTNLFRHDQNKVAMREAGVVDALMPLWEDQEHAVLLQLASAVSCFASDHRMRIALIDADVMRPLVALFRAKEVQAQAAQALGALAWPQDETSARVLTRLMTLLRGADRALCGCAAWALGMLSVSDGNRAARIVELGGLSVLTDVLRDGDASVCMCVAKALKDFSGYDDIRPAVVKTIFDLCHNEGAELRRNAAIVLSEYVSSMPSDDRMFVVQADRGERLMALLEDQDVGVREHAVRTVGRLASTHPGRAVIAQQGGTERLIAGLKEVHPKIRRCAAFAIFRLVEDGYALPRGGIAPVIALLSDEDVNARWYAANILHKVVWEDHSLAAELSRAIEPLAACLNDERSVLRDAAQDVLRDIFVYDWNSASAVAKAVVALLRTEDAHLCVHVVRALRALAFKGRFVIPDAVASLLRDDNPIIRMNAIEVLTVLAFKDSFAVPESVTSLLREEDAVMRLHVIECLRALASDDQNRVGVVESMVAFLSEEAGDGLGGLGTWTRRTRRMIVHGVEALGYLAWNAANRRAIVDAGGLHWLALLLTAQDPEVSCHTIGALRALARDDRTGVLVVDEVAAFLKDESMGVREHVMKALDALASDEAPRSRVMKTMVDCLGDADVTFRRHVLEALKRHIHQHEARRRAIAECGGIDALVERLRDEDDAVRKAALDALEAFAVHDVHRFGVMTAMVDLLGDADALMRARSAEALEHLSQFERLRPNDAIHFAIAEAGGIDRLLAVLSDAEPKIRRSAVKALAHLAETLECQMRMVRAGGVGALLSVLARGDEALRSDVVSLLSVLVTMGSADASDIIEVLETQLNKESDAETKKNIDYIVSYCDTKLASLAGHPKLPTEDLALLTPVVSQMCSPHFSSKRQGAGQKNSFSMGVHKIDASEITWGDCLGRGPFAKVYAARYHFEPVVVKKYVGVQVNSNDRAQIMADIGMMAALKDKHLVALLGVIEDPLGVPSLVMEFGERGSLYRYLGTHRDIPWGWRVRIAEELARGLAYLHEKNIVHQDIKSLNVVLDRDCHAKWCDFGLAVMKQQATGTHAHWDQAVSPLRWMAPELFEDKPVMSRQEDIWSYGMVLFELATQRVPYEGLNDTQVMCRLLRHQAEEVPEVCRKRVPKFAGLMDACWRPPAERPDAPRLVDVLMEAREECLEEKVGRASESLPSCHSLA